MHLGTLYNSPVAVSKSVVLARGLGKRMRESGAAPLRSDQAAAADAGAKAMMPLGREGDPVARPFLDFVLSAIADAGYRSTCLVVGPDHEAIRRYYAATSSPSRLAVHFAEQAEPRGTADAVAAAGSYIANDHSLVVNGDNYYPVAALAALRATGTAATMLFRSSTLVRHGNIPEERVRAFAICTLDKEGYLDRILEKPTPEELREAGPDPLVSMNCWLMPPAILDACRAIAPSPRGELELTHAVAYAIDQLGVRFRVLVSDEGVLDLSRREDVSLVATRLAAVAVHL